MPASQSNGLPWYWLSWPIANYIALGIVSFLLLGALAITSNKWSMQRLGKHWKRLHRAVYGAGVMILAHAPAAISPTNTVAQTYAKTKCR